MLPADALLAKTLTSSTFKLALIAIGAFGVIVSAIFSYVYLSTSAYVRGRSDRAIVTEAANMRDAYGQAGRARLAELIRHRAADAAFAGLQVVPLMASDLARLAADAHSRVGEEAHGFGHDGIPHRMTLKS